METRMTGFYQRVKDQRLLSSFLILATLGLGILIGTVISRSVKGKENPATDAAPIQMATPQQLSSAFSQIAKQIEPSVVNINTESTIKPQRRGRRTPNSPDDDNDMQDFFDRFFGGGGSQDDQGPRGFGGAPEGTRQRSLGCGEILESKG